MLATRSSTSDDVLVHWKFAQLRVAYMLQKTQSNEAFYGAFPTSLAKYMWKVVCTHKLCRHAYIMFGNSIDLMHWRHVSITTTPCWGSRLVALRARVVLAERIGAQPLSQCAGPGQPGGMACRGWSSGCMLGDGARGSATFDPQRAWAPFCDVICIRSITSYRGFPHDIIMEDKQQQTCALDHDDNCFHKLIHRVFITCTSTWLNGYLMGTLNEIIQRYTVWVKKRKPGFDSKFLQNEKDITKLISVHDCIIILLSFGTLFIHIRPWMAAQQ